MKYILRLLLGIMIAANLSGCAKDMETINKAVHENGKNINKNSTEAAVVRNEYADVFVSASLKTHMPGIYILDNKNHGTDRFKVVVHIDGKPLQMKSSMKKEDTSYLHEKDPEAGKGIRYNYAGSTRLIAGKHAIAVSIPEDDILMQQDIYLKEGSNKVVIEPVYGRRKPYRRIGFVGDTSFYEGIKGFKVVVNGEGR